MVYDIALILKFSSLTYSDIVFGYPQKPKDRVTSSFEGPPHQSRDHLETVETFLAAGVLSYIPKREMVETH